MKIFFRYLFMRLLTTFALVLAGCTIIWVMIDLYGNLDDFLEHRVSVGLVLRFYSLRVPQMLVEMLPAAVLFSTLFTLMNLNRRSELVALQSGGMAPLWMFSPFFCFSLLAMVVLAYDLSGPAAQAEVTRERLLKQVKGEVSGRNVFVNLPYVDRTNHLVWFFQKLDVNSNKGERLEILQRDAQGHDMVKYFAQTGKYNGSFWRLSGVRKIVFAIDGGILEQRTYPELDLPEMTTPPQQLSLIVSQPEQLTLSQLSEYIATSSQSEEHLAGYRTEWWYRLIHPFSILVLMLFALMQGSRSDRRGAMAGVGVAIVVLVSFYMLMSVFLAMGRFNRLPPFIAVVATEAIFGLIGLHLLALTNGWWWQLYEWWRSWYGEDEDEIEPAA